MTLHENASARPKLSDDTMCHADPFPSFEAETTNPAAEAYPLRLLHCLDTCHPPSLTTRSPSLCASAWLGQHSLRHFTYTLACRCSRAQFLGPTLHVRSSPLPVHRHELAWPSPRPSTVLVFHTCTSQDKRHVSQHYTHAMASLKHSHINHMFTILVTCSLGYWSKTLLLILILPLSKKMQF
jgi:hypothetical protein